MKVIDLLNKIANGEEVPKKFKIKGSCFKDLYFEYDEKYECYDLIGENFKNGCYVFGYGELNDEIEIIEEKEDKEKKIPEKLPLNYADDRKPEEVYEYLRCSYNQLIDYIKSKGE